VGEEIREERGVRSGREPFRERKRVTGITKRESAVENGERHTKASGADTGTKRRVILENMGKYSISAMSKVLKMARSTLYYKSSERETEGDLENGVI
jgi:hypothetical protein